MTGAVLHRGFPLIWVNDFLRRSERSRVVRFDGKLYKFLEESLEPHRGRLFNLTADRLSSLAFVWHHTRRPHDIQFRLLFQTAS